MSAVLNNNLSPVTKLGSKLKKKLRFVIFRGFFATILEITFRRNVF